jgi:hypothetical protein
MIAVRGAKPDRTVHYIPQVEYTYGVAGLMNDKQVSMVETTWGGRKELRNPEGWLDYYTMMMDRWDRLAKLLIVKHNDQIMFKGEYWEK